MSLLEQKEEISQYVLEEMQKEAGGLLRGNRLCGNQGYYPSGGDTGDHEYCASGGKKRAQANVITRREEVASTRSLLNTARLMDEKPDPL